VAVSRGATADTTRRPPRRQGRWRSLNRVVGVAELDVVRRSVTHGGVSFDDAGPFSQTLGHAGGQDAPLAAGCACMKSPASARVLVIGASETDVELVFADLKRHFKDVETATTEEAAQERIALDPPDVIVLAFKDLEEAQPYCRAPGSSETANPPLRSVLLCQEEGAAAAFELCKRKYFDDYVIFWPAPPDRLRLSMSLWLACRAALALHEQGETGSQLLNHAKQLGDLDRAVTREIESGESKALAAHDSMKELEQKLSKANDEFSDHLIRGANAAIEVKDSGALARDLANFKTEQMELARAARSEGVKPMNAWAQQLRAKVEPPLAATRTFAAQVRQSRPTLLVVDDDDMTRGLLTPTLRSLGYNLVIVRDGRQVLDELGQMEPGAILMDLVAPGADAIGLTRRLKGLPDVAHIPIIIMSGDARRETLFNSIRAGASDFIAKPFTRDVLRTKLDRFLRRPASV
jgi:CheY-like chemotaxis protein